MYLPNMLFTNDDLSPIILKIKRNLESLVMLICIWLDSAPRSFLKNDVIMTKKKKSLNCNLMLEYAWNWILFTHTIV